MNKWWKMAVIKQICLNSGKIAVIKQRWGILGENSGLKQRGWMVNGGYKTKMEGTREKWWL